MAITSSTYVQQALQLEFTALKHACPSGVYVAPVHDTPLTWVGVLFPRQGPYATAVLRFEIIFTSAYPSRPPTIRFATDVFHPLVTPVTTYTHTTKDVGVDTVSSADGDRMPPGAFSLRHGFPEWYGKVNLDHPSEGPGRPPHIVEVLQYLRVAFDVPEVIDSVQLHHAANTGAWHAWESQRSRLRGAVSPSGPPGRPIGTLSPTRQQQPGGARRPGEWNWHGVWEDRVRKSVAASNTEHALYGGDGNSMIMFKRVNEDISSAAA
ncbi:hypothetical protein LTR62_005648 [Meristemomyces frigidus]|uniref:UBC core domain-containing protein n=1 Tax=Meristemomyces frigidus TaxID=1508187 RepID=A0AAN7TE76_9PEZI|nr:hypothetical protein LTR62_005648 [Meristemomyces frigidus]